MDSNDSFVQLLNSIKVSIDGKDEALWSYQGKVKCYQEAMAKLDTANEQVLKDIERMKKEIKELDPQVKMMEGINKENVRTIRNGYQTITHHRLYKRMLEDQLKKQKEEQDGILKAYQDHIDSIRNNLKCSMPKYKLLLEKEIELKKCSIRCKLLEQKIKERQKINAQKGEIRKKIFYAQFVALAKAWVERRDYLEAEQKLEELTVVEREWMKKVMESTEQLKQRKLESSKKDSGMLPFELTPSDFQLPTSSSGKELNDSLSKPVLKKSPIDPFIEIQNLIDSNQVNNELVNFLPVDEMPISTKQIFSANRAKVIVLENKIVKPMNMNKEERNKAIDAKIHKALKTISRRQTPLMNRSLIEMKSARDASFNCSFTHIQSVKDDNVPKNNKDESYFDFNMLSQEHGPFLSQELQNVPKPIKNAEPARLNQELPIIKSSLKMPQSTAERLSELKLFPQKQKGVISSGTNIKDRKKAEVTFAGSKKISPGEIKPTEKSSAQPGKTQASGIPQSSGAVTANSNLAGFQKTLPGIGNPTEQPPIQPLNTKTTSAPQMASFFGSAATLTGYTGFQNMFSGITNNQLQPNDVQDADIPQMYSFFKSQSVDVAYPDLSQGFAGDMGTGNDTADPGQPFSPYDMTCLEGTEVETDMNQSLFTGGNMFGYTKM